MLGNTLQLPIGSEWIWIAAIIIVLAVIGAIAVIKAISKKIPSNQKKRLDVLKDRLARGEISKEEYDKLKNELD